MGMAASQARLLTITARIHDVEYQAQSIQNAKVQLATQSDQVYQDYLEALDATTLTITDINKNIITATFNNLCGKNPVDSAYTYALQSSKGALIVPDEIKDGYDKFKQDFPNSNDPYTFALYMMGDYGQEIEWDELEQDEEDLAQTVTNNTTLHNLKEALEDMGGEDGYNDLSDEDKEKYDEIEAQYRYQLYNNDNAFKIYTSVAHVSSSDILTMDEEKWQEDFDYYVRMFRTIQASGGACVSIEDYNEGGQGDAANNSDWLQNMIQCGKISVSFTSTNNKTGEITLNTTSPSSDSALSYTTTTTIDKTALAKAEAEYEHKTKEIDTKDKRFDMDLSKLETERTALTTEYDSVKKVIQDNIERTFGIFS